MNSKMGQIFLLSGAGIVMLVFVKLMYDMSSNMDRMAAHVGSLATDVSAMRVSMDGMADDITKMRESMQNMDSNIQAMGGAVERGGKMFQQWDPTKMMRQ